MGTKRLCKGVVAVCLLCGLAGSVHAAPVYWTDWAEATESGAVIGTIITLGGDVTVTYTGDYVFAVVDNSGANYWAPESTFADGASVDNGPSLKDIIGLQGGGSSVHTLTFSQPVVNPAMAIVSLGQRGLPVTYAFDEPFDVIANGPGSFGNGPLTELAGQVLEGREGHGTIQFQGTVTALHWTIPTAEYWHGFTVGIAGPADDPGGPIGAPGPGALLLVGIGTSLVGYLRRHQVL